MNKGWGIQFSNDDDFNSLQGKLGKLNLKNGMMLGDITQKSMNTENKGGKYVVSQKNSSSTTTKNGHTIKKTIETLVYSDGTREVKQNVEQIY